MITAYLFDLDGTLVDSLPDIAGVVNDVRADLGLKPFSLSQVASSVGHGVDHLISGCIPEAEASEIPELVESYRRKYLENPYRGGQVYPSVLETLQTLQARPSAKIGIVTNKLTAVAIKTVEYYLPKFRFDAVFGPDKVSQRKPSPKHLLEALAFIHRKPANACFVGDDPVDGLCAERAGVVFFAATYGIGGVKAPPSHQLACLSDLLSHL